MTSWLSALVPARIRAAWLYQRGMARARRDQRDAAIEDYTAVIDMVGSTGALRGMALYNRALVYHTLGDRVAAAKDLNRVVAMPDAPSRVVTEARRKLVRIERTESQAGA